MAKYIIEGGYRLSGSINIFGSKNSVLPCMAAALLTEEEVILRNVPKIVDVDVFLEMLIDLGAHVEIGDHFVKINAQRIKSHELNKELSIKLRASVLFAGPLLSRVGKAKFTHPGGDIIGKRSIETHLQGFEELGFKFKIADRDYEISKGPNSSDNVQIFLDEASCTATENIVLAGVIGSGKVTIKNCAEEPQVVDLCNLLNQMGAQIAGIGSSTLIIKRVKKLGGADFAVSSDYIQMATYAIASAITKGTLKVMDYSIKDLEPVLSPLKKAGLLIKESGDKSILVTADRELQAIPKLAVAPWPGFPTDLVSIFIVLATQSKGVSLLHDWMYESRMFFADKLISMGAHITIADPHRVLVYGPARLNGRDMETPDIRAGMALVLAALVAKGTSVIHKAELIERGYEDVVGNLNRLGAKIERID